MSEVSYYRRIFDANGVFQRKELYDPLRIVGTPDGRDQWAIMVNGDAQKSMQPAYREQSVRALYRPQNQLIPLGGFPQTAFDGSNRPIYWLGDAEVLRGGAGSDLTRANGSSNRSRILGADSTGAYCMTFTGRPKSSLEQAASVSSPNIPLKAEAAMEIEIAFDYRMRSRTGNTKCDMMLFYEINCGTQYLSPDPLQWQAGRVTGRVFIGLDSYDNWDTLKIIAPNPPADGDFSITFFQVVYYDPAAYPEFAKDHTPRPKSADGLLQVDNVSARLLYNDSDPIAETSSTFVNSKRYTLQPDQDEITHADLPDYLNAELIYPYAWKVIKPDGNRVLTKRWKRLGYEESVPLLELNLDTLVNANREPTRRITATLEGLISPHHYVRVLYDDNRVYKVNGYTWDVRAREVQVELLEVLTGQPLRLPYRLLEDGRLQLMENYVPKLNEQYR